MTSEYFQVRKLIWDEMKQYVKPSEVEELRAAIGNQLIDENQELAKELAALVEILSEFQQQNDNIRDALIKRPRMPEPPGRALLLEKLKLLARDVHSKARRIAIQSSKEKELLEYVLSATDISESFQSEESLRRLATLRMSDLASPRSDTDFTAGVPIRPGTSSGKRPTTSGSQRPVSRGSTISVSSTLSLLESRELHKQLNVEQIDAILDDLQDALVDERQQLLEDIEFIQGCLEMEQDLIDDDRRKVAAKPPPSFHELSDLCKTLEKALEDQDEIDKVEHIFSKTIEPCNTARRASKPLHPVPAPSHLLAPRPPAKNEDEHPRRSSLPSLEHSSSFSSPPFCSSSARSMPTKVLKIRHVIQEARDEPFLS